MTEDTVQRFYEQEAIIYNRTRFKSSHGAYNDYAQRSVVLGLVGKCRDKYILEIGSGTGRFTSELTKRGARVICVDLSRKMHEQSRLLLHDNSVEYFCMSGSNLGFVNETFDGCLTVNMMSHIKNDSEIFAEISRVLKKGGFFVANFPNMSGIYFSIGVIVNLFERSLQAPVYSRWYTLGALIRSLKGARLNPVRVLGRMIFPKKYCPLIIFKYLRELDIKLRNSNFSVLSGDLFIKSQKF